MSKTLNSTPTSEWQAKDTCPNCGSPCDIYQDLDEKDFCNDCRPAKTPFKLIKKYEVYMLLRDNIIIASSDENFNGDFYLSRKNCGEILASEQSTEIEVMIELLKDGEWYEKYQGDPPMHFKIQHNQRFDGDAPKLDEHKCLILKRIV